MSYLQAIVYGIVQGLTEFLPISSTAHLRVVPALFGWDDPGSAFTAIIQGGTLVAVVLYFRQDVVQLTRAWVGSLTFRQSLDPSARLAWLILLGTVPIVLAGKFGEKWIDDQLRSLYVISAAAIGLALLLMLAEWYVQSRARRQFPCKTLEQLTWWDACLVGLAQACALIPGSSRSGTTLTGGLFLGLSRDAAARFSFLLSLPSVFAAFVYKLYKLYKENSLGTGVSVETSPLLQPGPLLVSILISGIVGYFSIAFLLGYLRKHSTWAFIVYRILLGLTLFACLLLGWLSP